MIAAALAIVAYCGATAYTISEVLRSEPQRYGRIAAGFSAMIVLALAFDAAIGAVS